MVTIHLNNNPEEVVLEASQLQKIYNELEFFLNSFLYQAFYQSYSNDLGRACSSLIDMEVDNDRRDALIGAAGMMKEVLEFFPNLFREVEEKINNGSNE